MNPRVPLAEQLAELKREMRLRKSVYPHFVARARLTPQEAERQMERLQACIVTLEWLQRHETRLRAAVA